MIPILPRPTEEEAEVFLATSEGPTWQAMDGFLRRCFDTVVAQLGQPESPRDEDQVLKGMKLALEHIAKLPVISKQTLTPIKEEVPDEV